MSRTYAKLQLYTLTPEQHGKTCGYWYTVRNDNMPHTAFRERAHLLNWLNDRGLQLSAELPAHGEWSTQQIIGAYREHSEPLATATRESFDALPGLRTRQLSNGRYTAAIISTDADGIRTVHTMNCNCPDREEFDSAESRALFG